VGVPSGEGEGEERVPVRDGEEGTEEEPAGESADRVGQDIHSSSGDV